MKLTSWRVNWEEIRGEESNPNFRQSMASNLRSVLAQVHRKSGSIGRLRNFSSTPRINVIPEPEPEGFGFWLVSRGLGLSLGCIGGYYLSNSLIAKTEFGKVWGEYEESVKRREKVFSELSSLPSKAK